MARYKIDFARSQGWTIHEGMHLLAVVDKIHIDGAKAWTDMPDPASKKMGSLIVEGALSISGHEKYGKTATFSGK